MLAGSIGIYAPILGKMEPTVGIVDFPLKWTVAGMARFYDKGINSVIPSQRAIPATLMDPKIKNRSRMWYQIANIEVAQVGEITTGLTDRSGWLHCRRTGDNFFMIKDGWSIDPRRSEHLTGHQ